MKVTPKTTPLLKVKTILRRKKSIKQKVQKSVQLFRRSTVKNDDHLQPYISKNFRRKDMLLLDCKTRRNSLLTMLERFHELKKAGYGAA